jgi:hypothetical protein
MATDGNGTNGGRSPMGSKPPAEAHKAAEAAILRDGEAARLALARQTALKVLTDPGVLTTKRLARLGSDGVARFVEELRRAALGQASRPDPVKHVAGTKPEKPNKPELRRSKPIGVAAISGWWQSTGEGAPHFEAKARSDAWFAGGLILSISLVLLLVTRL